MRPGDYVSWLVGDAKKALAELPPCCSRDGFTYFVRSESLIKIGKTVDPIRRMASLQAGSPAPLRLFALARGLDLEATCHSYFSEDRRHGEWFFAPPVVDRIKVSRAPGQCLRCSMKLL